MTIDYLEIFMSNESFPQIDMSYGQGSPGYNPQSELMRAIILRAIEDLNRPGELRDDALAFFNGDNDDEEEDYIFSFKSICGYLGFDPQATRESILGATRRISTRRRAA